MTNPERPGFGPRISSRRPIDFRSEQYPVETGAVRRSASEFDLAPDIET